MSPFLDRIQAGIIITLMNKNKKLMEMLAGYASAHRHPVNIVVHLIGIPTIMLGVLIPLSWVTISMNDFSFTLAHAIIVLLFLFYVTLDALFALAFLAAALLLSKAGAMIASLPFATSATIAAVCFFGGYLAQFVGHAVEKSMPVLVRHPIQANLAAPFFTVVEIFKLLGIRDRLFNEVQAEIEQRRQRELG